MRVHVVILNILIVAKLHAQVIWTGPTMSFTKPSSSDYTLAANQDRITENVWLTRANNRGIFNIKLEDAYINSLSPLDTEWAFGSTVNIHTLSFNNWEDIINSNPPSAINQNMVLHLITDDIYMDIKFTSWEQSSTGGSFSYERASNHSLSLADLKSNKGIIIFPNPATNSIKISGIGNQETYVIYNNLGIKVMEGTVSNNEALHISRLHFGIYLVCLENKKPIKIAILN